MHTPGIAIAWEIWRKNRWGLTLVAACLPLSLLVWAASAGRWPNGVRIFEFYIVLLSLVILFWAFSFTELDARGRHSGFPSRLFVLPVRTARLVSYPILYGVVSILVFYFVWLGVLRAQWRFEFPAAKLLCVGTVLASMMVTMQAIVWTLHRFIWTRLLLLSATGTTLAVAGILSLEPENIPWLTAPRVTAGCALAGLLAYATALYAVGRDRRGEWLGRLEWGCQALVDCLPWRGGRFTSAPRALFWMEWHRRGWLLGCSLGVLMALSLLLFPMSSELYLDATLMQLNLCALPFVALWFTWLAGVTLAKSDLCSPELSIHPITSLRPLHTGELVLAKFKVAAAVTILGWGVFAVLAYPVTRFSGGLGGLVEPGPAFWSRFPAAHGVLLRWVCNPVVLLTMLGLNWHAAVRGMCPSLVGSATAIRWDVVRIFGSWVALMLVVSWCASKSGHFPLLLAALPWVSGAVLLWKWTRAAVAFARVFRDELFTVAQCRVLLTLWLGLTLGGGASAAWACAAREIPWPLILFGAVWLLPSRDLPACARNLARNRHR